MDDQSGVDAAVADGGHDLVEREDDDVPDAVRYGVGGPQPEQQVGGGAGAGDCDAGAGQRRGLTGLGGQDEGAAAVPERAAARQQCIVLEDVGQYAVGDLQDVQLGALGHAVGDVDVGEGEPRLGRPGSSPSVQAWKTNVSLGHGECARVSGDVMGGGFLVCRSARDVPGGTGPWPQQTCCGYGVSPDCPPPGWEAPHSPRCRCPVVRPGPVASGSRFTPRVPVGRFRCDRRMVRPCPSRPTVPGRVGRSTVRGSSFRPRGRRATC